MNIAITAANGQLGRAIVEAAMPVLGKGNIVGIARSPEKASDMGIEIRKGDYNCQNDFNQALKGIDTVVIVSGMDLPEKRIDQHRNVINGAKQAGVRKIVYTSIFGELGQSAFDAIIQSNRQTEDDVKSSGLQWVIGRNGLYIDEDIAAIPEYVKDGKITNCAADGKCAYTSRSELGAAYTQLIQDDGKIGGTFNLCSDAVTQQQLAETINAACGLTLTYESMSCEAYQQDRIAAHGEFLGTVIAGIYTSIRNDAFNIPSDYEKAVGRPHKTIKEMIEASQCKS